MIILPIDPGYDTGLAVVDTKAEKVLWHKTVTGGWKKRNIIVETVWIASMEMRLRRPSAYITVFLIQNPMAHKKIPSFNYSGKQSPISLAKNIGLSSYIYGRIDEASGTRCKVRIIPPQRGKGMKMDKALFNRLHPEAAGCSEHVRDAVNMALGYTEIGG